MLKISNAKNEPERRLTMFYQKRFDSFLKTRTNPAPFPLHIHADMEIAYATNHAFQMQIEKNTYEVPVGGIAVIFPNTLHSYLGPSKFKTDAVKIEILNCQPDLMPQLKQTLLKKRPQNPVLMPEQIHEDVLLANNSLFSLPTHEDEILIGALLTVMLCHLFPELQLAEHDCKTNEDLATKIISYISTHYAENISLSSVANYFGVSKYTISRIFSNLLPYTFTEYVNILRINQAEHLLKWSDFFFQMNNPHISILKTDIRGLTIGFVFILWYFQIHRFSSLSPHHLR